MEKKVRKAISERLKTIRAELQMSQKECGRRDVSSNVPEILYIPSSTVGIRIRPDKWL